MQIFCFSHFKTSLEIRRTNVANVVVFSLSLSLQILLILSFACRFAMQIHLVYNDSCVCIVWSESAHNQMQINAMKCAGFWFAFYFCVREEELRSLYHTYFFFANPISRFIFSFSCSLSPFLFPVASFLPFDSLYNVYMHVYLFLSVLCAMCMKTHNFITLHYIHMKAIPLKLLMKTGQNPIEKCTGEIAPYR